MTPDPGALARRLLELPVVIEGVRVRAGGCALPGYEGGVRPSGLVALTGKGVWGFGENVAFEPAQQRALAAEVMALLHLPARLVGQALDAGPAHPRAAVEAAVIDLALKQAGLSLAQLAGANPAAVPLRWVASFGADDAVARARAARAAGARELKIDVDPDWSDAVLEALAVAPGVTTFDFKEGGTVPLAQRLRARFATALFEDPPAGYADGRCSRDRPLLTAADVGAAAARGQGVNLKCPRMGGPVAVLQGLAQAAVHQPPDIYMGGMHEVGPGREQARQLAALFCAGGPNDLGPIGGAPPPERIVLDQVGFGATCDWNVWADARLQG